MEGPQRRRRRRRHRTKCAVRQRSLFMRLSRCLHTVWVTIYNTAPPNALPLAVICIQSMCFPFRLMVYNAFMCVGIGRRIVGGAAGRAAPGKVRMRT